jgi:polysaccharide export outer membrane protein
MRINTGRKSCFWYTTALCSLLFVFYSSSLPAVEGVSENTLERKLIAGDRIQIKVNRFEEYSGVFAVNPEGLIEHPLLGNVRARGYSVEEFEQNFTRQLAKYVRQPEVNVSLRTGMAEESPQAMVAAQEEIYLMGEISTPGAYTYQPGITLLQLLAKAGGAITHPMKDYIGNVRSTGANMRNVSVFRSTGETIKVNVEQIQKTGDQSQNVELFPGDTIFIPAGTGGQFSVLGQVKRPGPYPVEGKITLMEALVQAGGFGPNGSLKNIRVVRTQSEDPQAYRVNLWEILKGGRLEQIPYIQAGDAIFVEPTLFYHWERFVSSVRGAAISTESVRVIRDFDDRTTGASLQLR